MSTSPATEIDNIIDSQPNWKGSLLRRLRGIIVTSGDPISEAVKWKMPSKPLGSPAWESNGIVCVADFLKSAVRLTFPRGASIDDPTRLFNARLDSATVRAIDFPEDGLVDAEELTALITRAVALNAQR